MKNNETTFEFNGMTYSANSTRSYCWSWPTGLKGQRTRIKKSEFEAAEAEHKIEVAVEDPTVSVEEFAKMVGAEVTEEPTAPEAPEAPKAKRVRKPKDIGHTSTAVEGVTLTAKQVDFIRHLPDTCFWEHGLDSAIWVDCLCDDIGGQFKGKPMTVGAMISTLCEKGLGTRCKQRVNGKKATSFELTENGKLVAAELGLN